MLARTRAVKKVPTLGPTIAIACSSVSYRSLVEQQPGRTEAKTAEVTKVTRLNTEFSPTKTLYYRQNFICDGKY